MGKPRAANEKVYKHFHSHQFFQLYNKKKSKHFFHCNQFFYNTKNSIYFFILRSNLKTKKRFEIFTRKKFCLNFASNNFFSIQLAFFHLQGDFYSVHIHTDRLYLLLLNDFYISIATIFSLFFPKDFYTLHKHLFDSFLLFF